MTAHLELLLEGFPALRGLPPALLGELEGAVVRRAADAGEYLFRQQAGPPTHAYFLISASVDILLGPPGDERPVGRSHPGQLVGWVTLSATDLFPVSARMVEPGEVLEITMRALDAEGWGQPPAEFCFILMGSHGRHENHFNTDQDHGMILADYPPGDWQRVQPYFMDFESLDFRAGCPVSAVPVKRHPFWG